MAAWSGPVFKFVPEITWESFLSNGGVFGGTQPLLVKGAVKAWPAWSKWSFDSLADLRRRDGSQVTTSFQSGLVEQGMTRKPVTLPIEPYLRDLKRRSECTRSPQTGLLSDKRRSELGPGDSFELDWSYMSTFRPDRVYLAQWNILDEFPEMRKDFAIRTVWPGMRWTWEYVFIGPEHTITGFHFDFPNNWFCQVRGTKEVLLVSPDQSHSMCRSRKYDWGATLSDIDITKIDVPSPEREAFSRVRGLYARVEPGDALFIPRRTWHAVVAMEPSISLAVFGLTPLEILIGGGASTVKDALHHARLYRWGNCTCHGMHST